MKIRVFNGSCMTEAMRVLRLEMGDDAVILSSRHTENGVEVTAVLDSDEPLLIPPDSALKPRHVIPPELLRHNLPPDLAARLRGPMAKALEDALPFAGLPDPATRTLALVGPPGAGKTLTCAKLATRLVMSGQAPTVITADAARAGATEQLAAFTRVLDLTLSAAVTPGQISRAVARRTAGQPVLLDTAGCDPFERAQAEHLLAVLRAADAHPVLVLPAGLDVAEATEISRAYAALGARCMIATRLDQARRLGSVLAAAEAGPLALSEAGVGPNVANDLVPITPDWLATRLSVNALQREYEAA